jgi:hypothetical protein
MTVGSSPTSDLGGVLSSSNDTLSGDNGVVAEGTDVLTSKGNICWLLKNDLMKAYSAVELSMNTRKRDRRRASIGSFCLSESTTDDHALC